MAKFVINLGRIELESAIGVRARLLEWDSFQLSWKETLNLERNIEVGKVNYHYTDTKHVLHSHNTSISTRLIVIRWVMCGWTKNVKLESLKLESLNLESFR